MDRQADKSNKQKKDLIRSQFTIQIQFTFIGIYVQFKYINAGADRAGCFFVDEKGKKIKPNQQMQLLAAICSKKKKVQFNKLVCGVRFFLKKY